MRYFNWDAAGALERDIWIDTHLFGAEWHYESRDEHLKAIETRRRYTTDPAADYAVLEKVRGEWDEDMRHTFACCLTDLLYQSLDRSETWDYAAGDAMFYRAGMYSHGAFLAKLWMEEHGNDE